MKGKEHKSPKITETIIRIENELDENEFNYLIVNMLTDNYSYLIIDQDKLIFQNNETKEQSKVCHFVIGIIRITS